MPNPFNTPQSSEQALSLYNLHRALLPPGALPPPCRYTLRTAFLTPISPSPLPMQSHFRVGVFTSASKRTVQVAVAMLEEAAGVGPPLFDPKLVLHRVHTQPAPPEHIASGGKPWDTVKPLHRHFGRLHRVILMDDDGYKVRKRGWQQAGGVSMLHCVL